MSARWPAKRPDGCIIVSARFRVDDAERFAGVVVGCVEQWEREKQRIGVETVDDLVRGPYPRVMDGSTVDVVFEATPTSRRWKDWLVDLTREIGVVATEAQVVGFVDDISGRVRPAA
jgi:hypothetical protein